MQINVWNEITSEYYCYLHKRADSRIFYVGKGKYERATDLKPSRRNTWCNRIITKEGKDNIIIELIPAIDEEDAFRLEKLYILFLKPYFKLCNFTDGGEGTSGYKWTGEQRIARSGSKHPAFGKIGELNCNTGRKHSEEEKIKMSIGTSGNKNSSAKLTWEQVREIRVKYSVGGITLKELAKEYNICFQNIGNIILNKHWKEWYGNANSL